MCEGDKDTEGIPWVQRAYCESYIPEAQQHHTERVQELVSEVFISSFPESESDDTAKFTNGSMCNFRYISQQGKQLERITSNQLSATYDLSWWTRSKIQRLREKDSTIFLDAYGEHCLYETDP